MNEWQSRAACLGDLNFTERPYSEQRPVCFSCPVQSECLSEAIETEAARDCELVVRGGLVGIELARAIREGRGGRQPVRVHVCHQCRAKFSSATPGVMYCSTPCRKAHSAQNRRSRAGAVA